MKRILTFLAIAISLSLLLWIAILPAQAVYDDDDGIISAGEVIVDDVFISAEKVIIDGSVHGNVFVNASEVIVNGDIDGNLLVFAAQVTVNGGVRGSIAFAGQTLRLNGAVNGSVFAAGAALILLPDAHITHNVYFAGFSLEMQPSSHIDLDLLLQTYQAIVSGTVAGSVQGSMSVFELDGQVGGDIKIEVDAAGNESATVAFTWGEANLPDLRPSGIRISEQASVGGQVHYTSPSDQSAQIALSPEQVIFEQFDVKQKISPQQVIRDYLLSAGRDFVTLLILGALALWLLPRPLTKASRSGRELLPSFGWGILIAILLPVFFSLAGALIFITGILLSVVTLGKLAIFVFLIGFLALALSMVLLILFAVYGSKLIVAKMIGDWLFERISPASQRFGLLALVVGIVLYSLFALLPIVGWLISWIVSLIGTGALWLLIRARWKRVPRPIQA